MGTLSGGQRRRADVAVALIGNPELLFLDEPTTGFDPGARREAWSMIEGLKNLGTTVLLTTHYMDEAEHLADRVAIIRSGKIVATGAPSSLGAREESAAVITFVAASDGVDHDALSREIGVSVELSNGVLMLRAKDDQATLRRLLDWSERTGVRLQGLEVRRPSLEDMFLELTAESTEATGATERSR
jgi:ABC-2 type transport system ATP-binding protein